MFGFIFQEYSIEISMQAVWAARLAEFQCYQCPFIRFSFLGLLCGEWSGVMLANMRELPTVVTKRSYVVERIIAFIYLKIIVCWIVYTFIRNQNLQFMNYLATLSVKTLKIDSSLKQVIHMGMALVTRKPKW
jgi:predicted ABC-type sugar transport system permease subunit